MFSNQLGRHLAIFALLPALAFMASHDTRAEDSAGNKAQHSASAVAPSKSSAPRLNVIDRQRMLGEMMAKGLCFIDLRVDKKLHRNQMSVAQYVFHSTLENLVQGSAGLQIAPETDPELKKAVEDIKLAWVKYAEPLNSWTGGRWGKKQFALKVYEVDEEYGEQLADAVELYRKVLISQGSIGEDAAKTILAAGMQRTLTQQIAKQFCQSLSDYKPDVTPDRLKASLALYKDTTAKFEKGDAELGLSDEQPGLVLDNIELAKTAFAKIEPILNAAADGNSPSEEELALVSATNLELLRHWEKVVATYVLLN